MVFVPHVNSPEEVQIWAILHIEIVAMLKRYTTLNVTLKRYTTLKKSLPFWSPFAQKLSDLHDFWNGAADLHILGMLDT